ncbi:MAG: hypothetical protein NG737_02985 [Omnitrophica bacterium]|nr:hypothetical protein [Candidatus Omnitrophota bacterium]
MVRMADIFKKALKKQEYTVQEETKKESPPKKKELGPEVSLRQRKYSKPQKVSTEIQRKSEPAKEPEKKLKKQSNISQFVKKKSNNLGREDIGESYEEAITLIKDIYKRLKNEDNTASSDKAITIHIERFVSKQSRGDNKVLALLHSSEENYPYDHVINVCIVSVEIGLGLEYSKDKLVDLGVAAFLHKIGMLRIYQLDSRSHPETKGKFSEIEGPRELNSQTIDKFENIASKFISAAYQDLEHMTQIGYPKGLDDDIMFEYSKIIGLADLYEVLVYPGFKRGRIQPYEVLNLIIRIKNSFGEKVIKSFIERISCPFPIGAYVRLSSGENAKVIGRNLGYPLNPVVEVCDIDSDRPQDARIINLEEYPNLHIQGYLKD